MKARIKATGEIVEISTFQDNNKIPTTYDENELEFLIPNDYWTRLEHQYAGMAMQGMLNNSLLITGLLKVNKSHENIVAEVTGTAIRYAHALVEKMKEAD